MNNLSRDEIYGMYSPVNYKHTFDTIIFKAGGLYTRKLYNAEKRLILDIKGEWELTGDNRFKISGFYLNYDDDLIRFPVNTEDPGYDIDNFFEKSGNTIQFCVGHFEGENCYVKIK